MTYVISCTLTSCYQEANAIVYLIYVTGFNYNDGDAEFFCHHPAGCVVKW